MAATITDNVDLLAAELILRSEYDRLNTYDRKADAWIRVHTRAWTEVKKDLLNIKRLEESDLDDPTELEDVVLMKVLEIAYRSSDVDGDSVKAKRWGRRYEREFQTVKISSGGSTLAASGRTSTVLRG